MLADHEPASQAPASVTRDEVRRLVEAGAQLVEVLPRDEFDEEHLPGAVSLPLKSLTAETSAVLDRSRPVIVYCWDGLCDMSPRAACRLTQLGFAPVYDYTLGKVDWIAAGLPTDRAGKPSRRVLDAIRRDVPTCAPDTPAGPALRQARAQGWDRCVVIAGQRTVAGMLRADRISAGEQAPAAEVMQPGPATVRAHEDLDATRQRMNERHVAHLLVTTPDGTLLGVVDAADS